jgi:hypothetical protein
MRGVPRLFILHVELGRPLWTKPVLQVEGSLPMRGDDRQTEWMFSYVSPEARVRRDHPLRAICRLTDAVLARLSPEFDRLYSRLGRPSIPAEKCCVPCCCRACTPCGANGC